MRITNGQHLSITKDQHMRILNGQVLIPVELNAQQWGTVVSMLSEGPHKLVVVLINEIVRQVSTPEQAPQPAPSPLPEGTDYQRHQDGTPMERLRE